MTRITCKILLKEKILMASKAKLGLKMWKAMTGKAVAA